MELIAFGVSAAVAQLLTNIDNLAALLALSLVVGKWRAIAGYTAAQAVILTLAMVVAVGSDQLVPSNVGLLGLIPVGLGLRGLWQQFRRDDGGHTETFSRGSSFLMTSLLFLSLSMDSFAVMAPVLADSAPLFRIAALISAIVAVLALGAIGLVFAVTARATGPWTQRFERLAPFVMIAAGIYVLLDSGTDLL
ncbi:Cadmium resistance transporter [Falsiruegeria litorea R37]|uniref:Cadmium resistance transporter n=1 Tax=Falsiruegeria litorea R37 TaxID=1200284 RepID=A0A1Y5SC84_9RHOB|nr:cadmium resistance transporter [Falsiruegeria litorea]SLN37493.1 Cadmium resistance transporter [Falsiruegeria litorea R37]